MSFIPDVFVIGATKAGTSTFWKVASEHPEIAVTRSKEVNYFIRDYSIDQLENVYSKQIQNSCLIKMDVSPAYSRRHAFPGVAKRIYEANRSAKIIYLVRNPIKRIISHLHHNLYRHRIHKYDLNRVVLEAREYICTSQYFFQIEDYLNYFNKDAILVLEMEEMEMKPEKFWASVAFFLKISPFPVQSRSYNVSDKRYLVPFHDFFHRNVRHPRLIRWYHQFWYIMNIKLDRPELSNELIEDLRIKLRPDAERLGKEFNLDTAKWFV
jgi:hypothetical protein